MEFKPQQAIYLQIAEQLSERILRHEWKTDNKIPSVRELAVELVVNPNTVMRAYAELESKGIIYKARGVGYYVSPDAYPKIIELHKTRFLKEELPNLFKKLSLLKISMETLKQYYEKHQTHEENL